MAQTTRLNREQLLEAMETNWATYLPTLQSLTEEEQTAFARQQGYQNLRDFLAHICAWLAKGLEVIPVLAQGSPYQQDWVDDDDFNARAVARYQNQTLEQVEEDFENLRTDFTALITELSDETLNHPDIYEWVYANAVQHYQQHIPPGDPQVPAEQYGGTY